MFPMEFDHRILDTLPVPTEERVKGIQQILRTIVVRRVLPYFRVHRGTDPLVTTRALDSLFFGRLEDEGNRIRVVAILTGAEEKGLWRIQIHERIFDYLAFVIPNDPEVRFGEGSLEEQKMLAFSEFFLRHELEHLLYAGSSERKVIVSDMEFALERRESDPTFYRMLRLSLADEMNGIRGDDYLSLLDAAEQSLAYDPMVGSILNTFVMALSDAPGVFLHEVFSSLDLEVKTGVLGEYCRRSRSSSFSLLDRAFCFQRVLRLFGLLVSRNEKEAMRVFHAFKDRWGLVSLFQELNLPEESLDNRLPEELFQVFKAALKAYSEEDLAFGVMPGPMPRTADSALAPSLPKAQERAVKSLKDRIEDARNNPVVPRRVMEVIDKNKLNAVGHSGSKYSELIETLLSIPWGRIQKISVLPEVFEEGLNRSHYGLQRPKEILCDFFTNLIWRYSAFTEERAATWRQTGSAFLFVGPPGVGKTSLAISIAQNLGIPYHKISLGGMRDEADIRGHGFTYEGSKPGAILQGLIKMEAMNGMFILDEADKMEKFAIATLLEILDPEQNHLFHDKYTETTVDIDLSNSQFILTANTLETVPSVVVNRCEVVLLDRYSVEEKIAIARRHLIQRLREKYQIDEEQIYFDPERESDLLRYLIRTYTYEAGVRELERIIRTLFLRVQRKEILTRGKPSIRITRERIKEYLREPRRPRQMAEEDSLGETLALGVDVERGVGSIIPIQATRIRMEEASGVGRHAPLSIVHATGNIEKVMDESRKVATTGIFHCALGLGIDTAKVEEPVHLHFMGGSTRKDGPSAGGAIALALASLLSNRKIRRDVAMTGEIDTRGRITAVGGLAAKIETAYNAGCSTVIIPRENLYGEDGIERFPDALKEELLILTYEDWCNPGHESFDHTRHILQVVAVEDIIQASDVASLDDSVLTELDNHFDLYAHEVAEFLKASGMETGRRLFVVQVKTPEEIDPGSFMAGSPLCPDEVVLLIPPEIREPMLLRMGGESGSTRVRNFDPLQENLSVAIQGILSGELDRCVIPMEFCSPSPCAPSPSPSPGVRLTLVAPYFFLKRDGICAETFVCGPSFLEMNIFANNYTAQEIKIKACKAVLDRIYCILSALGPRQLSKCPFLNKRNGIHVIDLSFIPEKYRLDTRRAELILNRSLNRWLRLVMSLCGQPMEDIHCRPVNP